jgi:hypothetical protein
VPGPHFISEGERREQQRVDVVLGAGRGDRCPELADYLVRNAIEFVDTVATLRWPGTATPE